MTNLIPRESMTVNNRKESSCHIRPNGKVKNCPRFQLDRIICLLCVYICHYIFPFYYLDIYFYFFKFISNNKCPNNKKEIYNDKYKHTRDRLFGLVFNATMNKSQIKLYHTFVVLYLFYYTFIVFASINFRGPYRSL